MDRCITKQSQVPSDNPTPDQGQAIDTNVDNDPINPPENNIEVEEALPDNTNTHMDNNSDDLNPSSDAGEHIIEDFISKTLKVCYSSKDYVT